MQYRRFGKLDFEVLSLRFGAVRLPNGGQGDRRTMYAPPRN